MVSCRPRTNGYSVLCMATILQWLFGKEGRLKQKVISESHLRITVAVKRQKWAPTRKGGSFCTSLKFPTLKEIIQSSSPTHGKSRNAPLQLSIITMNFSLTPKLFLDFNCRYLKLQYHSCYFRFLKSVTMADWPPLNHYSICFYFLKMR